MVLVKGHMSRSEGHCALLGISCDFADSHTANVSLPQVILCTKEVNEKTRMLAFKLLIKLGYTVQKCYEKKADGT